MPKNRPPVSTRRAALAMLGFAWMADRPRAVLAFTMFGLQALVQVLFALWLKELIDGLKTSNRTELQIAAAGLAMSVVGTSALSYVGNRVLAALRDRTQVLLYSRMLDLMGNTPTLELHETPQHLAQLDALRREGHGFANIVPSLIQFFAIAVRVVTTALLLISVSPLLFVLPLFGVPALLLSPKTGGLFFLGMELAAEPARRAEHLVELSATPGGAKEIRLFGLGPELLARFHTSHRQVRDIHHRLQVRAAWIGLAGRMIFLLGYLAAILYTVDLAIHGHASVGDTILVAVLAGQILSLVTGTAEILQQTISSMVAASRYLYLQDVAQAARDRVHPTATVPARLTDGIRLHHVTYHYPGRTAPALHDVDLWLPAGATVAVVGDNGAGKSTLVKLLTGMYLPSQGTITLDGTDLTTVDPYQWRQRTSAGFQDHAHFEFLVRDTIGIGDLHTNPGTTPPDPAIHAALDRAGAADLTPDLPAGFDTQLGASWPDGIDLSGGQWQKIALGRAMMRTTPLLLVLDEPTAALDADTEHRLFQRWTAAAHNLRDTTGTITVLVSHRYSTVRMADLIVVLSHGTIAEIGTHEELVARNGLYAELFELQARTYRSDRLHPPGATSR